MAKSIIGPTAQLGKFSSALKWANIPDDIRSTCKYALVDALGCAILGSVQPWGEIVAGLVKDVGGVKESTVWCNGFMAPAMSAALVNGVLIHGFDFDDYHGAAKHHPAAPVIPAAIAVAERLGSNGIQLLTGIVAGYETMIRVGIGIGAISSRLRGWHLTGTCGTFGAAAAAGNILGMNPTQLTNALGLAGTQSAGLWAFNCDGSMSKRLHPGKSAQAGVLAVDLVSRGFTGPTEMIEYHDGGFANATSDKPELHKISEGLGEKYQMADLTLKPYCCCGSIHSSIDAALELKARHSINPAEIEHINAYGCKTVEVQIGWEYVPTTVLRAQMSLRYGMAVALIEGYALVDQYTEEKVRDPQIVELAKKIDFVYDPAMDSMYPEKFCTRVEIFMKSGETYEMSLDNPKGSSTYPLTESDVFSKFRSNAKAGGKEDKADSIINSILTIENMKDLSELTKLLI